MDGTEVKQDGLTGETSVEPKGTSEQPETYTKDQMQKVEQKARSDALAEVGRYKKTADEAIKATKAVEERIDRLFREQEEAELDEHKDDPPKLREIRARQKERERLTKLDNREAELNQRSEELEQKERGSADVTKEQYAREIAQRFEVPEGDLLKFTDGSKQSMEELAQKLTRITTKVVKTDSGVTIGGSDMPDSAKGKIRAGWDELKK